MSSTCARWWTTRSSTPLRSSSAPTRVKQIEDVRWKVPLRQTFHLTRARYWGAEDDGRRPHALRARDLPADGRSAGRRPLAADAAAGRPHGAGDDLRPQLPHRDRRVLERRAPAGGDGGDRREPRGRLADAGAAELLGGGGAGPRLRSPDQRGDRPAGRAGAGPLLWPGDGPAARPRPGGG